MDKFDHRRSFITNERITILVNNLLVSAMLTCLTISLTQFSRALIPSWENGYLPWIAFLVSIDALYTKRATRKLMFPDLHWFVIRISELVVILFAVKIYLYILRNPAQLIMDIPAWREDFFGNFFSGEYLAVSLLVILIWIISGLFGSDLQELEVDEPFTGEEIPRGSGLIRQFARDNLVTRVFFLGGLMILLATFIRIDLQSLGIARSPLHPSAINILLYFFFSLVLMSQTQLAIIRAGWIHQRLQISENIGVRWVTYSVLFLFGVVGLVIFLPTRYSLGFLDVLNYVLEILVSVVLFLWEALVFLFLLFFSLLGLHSGETNPSNIVPQRPLPPPPSNLNTTPLPWIEFIKSIIFWVIFFSLVIFSTYQFLNQHQELIAKIRQIPGWRQVQRLLERFFAWLRGVNRTIRLRIESGFTTLSERQVPTALVLPRFISLKRLSPRQKVLFFYFALVRRGREKGFERQAWQTPFEYNEKLREALPDVSEDVSAMTDTFVEARYSKHLISTNRAGFMQRWWQKVRKALRR